MTSAIDFNVSAVEFIVTVLLVASGFFWLPAVRLRQMLWACGNLFVLWLVLPNATSAGASAVSLLRGELGLQGFLAQQTSAIALAVFLLSGYAMVRLLKRLPSGWLLSTYLVLLVAAFLVLKQYAILDWLLPPVVSQSVVRILGVPIRDGVLQHLMHITGLSYMLFRQVHVLVDAAQGQIERISLWSYLNYQVSFFTLLAGPIQRFQDFEEQWRTLEPVLAGPHELLQNCQRLLLGVLKTGLLAPIFYTGWDQLQGTVFSGNVSGWKYFVQLAAVFYSYPLYLYFNFSGYCDIVIAACRFFGMTLPENFNRPYLARNVIEFWTRWHITLGTWIRDYLFMPMYKPVVERWPNRAQSVAWIFYFPAFVVAGVWHGTTLNFFYYGIWQGMGCSATKLYETWLLARLGRKGLREYLQSRGVRLAAILLNLHFQCVSMLIFSQKDVSATWRLFRGLVSAVTGHAY